MFQEAQTEDYFLTQQGQKHIQIEDLGWEPKSLVRLLEEQ